MDKITNVSVIGAGAWGTTIANHLANKNYPVSIWAFEKEVVLNINNKRENSVYLPQIKLSKKIKAFFDIEETVKNADVIVIAIPTKHLRKCLENNNFAFNKKTIFLSLTKGIEKNTFKRPSEIISETKNTKKICALSGPNLSLEIAKGLPAATVIASANIEDAKKLQEIFSSSNFRVYTSDDIIGVEIGGALKNVIAIAAGISDGLKLGNNAKSGLIVRGIKEITRLGVKIGANKETFFGLSGIGDLITTCQSDLSRNHFVGYEIAKGKKLKDILSRMKAIPEGVETTLSAFELSKKLGVEMPITNEIHSVLFEDKNPKDAIINLMTRPYKNEN